MKYTKMVTVVFKIIKDKVWRDGAALKTVITLPEILCPPPNTHMVAYNQL